MRNATYKLPESTLRQIHELSKFLDLSQGRVIERAVDRLYMEVRKCE